MINQYFIIKICVTFYFHFLFQGYGGKAKAYIAAQGTKNLHKVFYLIVALIGKTIISGLNRYANYRNVLLFHQ